MINIKLYIIELISNDPICTDFIDSLIAPNMDVWMNAYCGLLE